MKEMKKLIERIIDRVNVNLRNMDFDIRPYVEDLIPFKKFLKFHAFYGITRHHPLHMSFRKSNISGSYFLGKSHVNYSVVYKSDIRGDELKTKDDVFTHAGLDIPLHDDECFYILDSFLVKTLVHNSSHDPERPEEFQIRNTVALRYSNIHGAPIEGSFLAPFATVDLTTVHNSVVGEYSYVQTGELTSKVIKPGFVWVKNGNVFDFTYTFPKDELAKYVSFQPGKAASGIIVDFIESRKKEFEPIYDSLTAECGNGTCFPNTTAANKYSIVKDSTVGENVIICQGAYLDQVEMGDGANAQENCYIVRSKLRGMNVTAHGGKIINADMGRKTFVGFNSFIRGTESEPLTVGSDCIIFPHTIIDAEEKIDIPDGHGVWGLIRNRKDLETHSVPLDKLAEVSGTVEMGAMKFMGDGNAFVSGFRHRIDHILEGNGAFFNGTKATAGHAQLDRKISFNMLQPFPDGKRAGIYPDIEIKG